MTDTPTPGSEWLLPVRYMLTSSRYGMEFDTASDTITVSHEDCESLIPASRLTDLEAEVARLNKTLVYEENLTSRIGTHGPGCYMWGPNHYECLKAEFGRVADLYYDTRDELRDALTPKD